MMAFQDFIRHFREDFIVKDRWLYLFNGLGNTLLITLLAGILGVAIGLVIAVIKVAQDSRPRSRLGRAFLKPLGFFADLYLTVIRGTPAVVQLLIIYFVVFSSVNVPKIIAAVIAFGINSGAYVAEIVRAGIQSVDRGQTEAGRSLGLSSGKTMGLIILPQAFKNILPALGNEFIALLKETAIVGYIAMGDLAKGGDIIRSQTYDAYLPLFAVALIYLLIVVVMTQALKFLERILRQSDHR